MRQIDLPTLTPRICQIAVDAGKEIMHIYENFYGDSALTTHKSDKSPLTLADMASHYRIAQSLSELTTEIPVVSEEETESLIHSQNQGLFWLIDPLDGTKEFLARNGEFTVNIALIEDGFPIWGVVYAPALKLLYWGGQNYGAFCKADGRMTKLKVSSRVEPGQTYRVVTSKSHLNEETVAFMEKLGTTKTLQAGSSLKFCMVAEGNADVYPRMAPTCEWDTAAGQAVVEGAGGYVYDSAGVRLCYGKSEILNPSFIVSSAPLNSLME